MKKILASFIVLAMIISSFSSVFANSPILVPKYGITVDANQNVFVNGVRLGGDTNPQTLVTLSQDEVYGFGRIVSIMHKNPKTTDAKLVSVQLGPDGTYVIVSVQSSQWWTNGNWKVEVVEDKVENQKCDKNQYWYGLYDKNMKRYGICIASKIYN